MDASCERGQTLAEYALVLGVITVGIVAAFGLLNGAILALFEAALARLA